MTPLLSEQRVGDWWHFQGCTGGRRFLFPWRLFHSQGEQGDRREVREGGGNRSPHFSWVRNGLLFESMSPTGLQLGTESGGDYATTHFPQWLVPSSHRPSGWTEDEVWGSALKGCVCPR